MYRKATFGSSLQDTPHSIQGLGPDGCEFLLAFDQGTFSEYTTFLLSGWLAQTPTQVLSQNFNIPEAELSSLPEAGLYTSPGTLPGPLEDDRKAVGGRAVASKLNYTFRMKALTPLAQSAGGSIRVADPARSANYTGIPTPSGNPSLGAVAG